MHQRLKPVAVALPDYGVFVLESHHAPGFSMAPSRHDFLEMFYVLHGRGSFIIANQHYPCRTNQVVVVPAGQIHYIEDNPTQPLSLYGICMAPAVLEVEGELAAALPPGRLNLNELIVPRVRADLRQMLYEQTLARPGYRSILVGLALQMIGLLVRGHLVRSRRESGPSMATASGNLATVQQYVAELPQRFFEPSDIDRTAAALGMSRRRFTQLFRGVTGRSWLDHLTGLRINYACQLLRQTQRSVLAVAFECGFEDLSSFYRAFKRRMGLPPNEWRQQEKR
jgi:AraC family L-rhamnose operon regulatory protein RhaS